LLADLDSSGNVQWSTTLSGASVNKLRCLGAGNIVVAGISGGHAMAAQYESNGTNDWTWNGSDPVAAPLTFDVDDGAAVYVGANAPGKQVVYALDSGGNLRWSWYSGGSAHTFAGIAVSDVVDVTGSVTGSIDTSDNVRWTSNVPGAAISIDDADDVFLCSGANAALLRPDGSTRWTYPTSIGDVVRADVTNGVARCIGGQGGAVGIVAFQVP
jgi:hypothetical protein